MKITIICICAVMVLAVCLYFAIRIIISKTKENNRLKDVINQQQKAVNEINNYIKRKEEINDWKESEEYKAESDPSAVAADIVNANNSRMQKRSDG